MTTGAESPAGTTVLLVEDNAAVRTIARLGLMREGFRVLEAGDGEEALAVFAEAAVPIDVVVTDLGLPRLDGAGLAARLHQRCPHLPVLFVSSDGAPPAAPGQRTAFVPKPYLPPGLARAIHSLLHPLAAPVPA